MYHLNQQQISIEIRRPHINRLKKRLMRQLQTPGLSAEQRTQVKAVLDNIGQPKVYEHGEPKPGAIDPGPMPQDLPDIDFDNATQDSLGAYSQPLLVRHAIEMELDVPKVASKAHVIKMILEHLQGESP